MKRYDSYKDSGVEWIGEIPSSWKKLKIKYLFSHTKGKNGQKLTKEFIGNNPGEYPVYSGTTKGEGHLGKTNEYEFDTQEKEVIFVSTVGSDTTVMSTKVLKGKFNLSQNCLIMTPIFDFSSRYQYYFTTHDFPYQRKVLPIVLKEGHRSVGMGELNEFTSLLPPLFEQQQIVSFLDTKTSHIDSLIEKTQQKIELLKEKKTSLINEVVTKGLNPNVEMKDSGVEWIGKIPIHYQMISIKFLVTTPVTDGPHETPVFVDEGIPFLSVNGVVGNKINFNKVRGYITNELHIEYSKKCKPQRDDVLLVKSGSTTGKSTIVETDLNFNIWSPLCIIRSNTNKIIPRFTFHTFQSGYFIELIENNWSYGTQPNIGMNVVENLSIVVPPISEQQQIVDYLDEQTELIDKTIFIEEKRIELLKEYRQSLISEVVTGKRKVTN
jgi:type I restriction enzyme, S subunit